MGGNLTALRRRLTAEPKLLLALGAIAGFLLLLAKVAEDVVEKESGSFDRAILLALRVPGDLSVPIGPTWLQAAFADITSLGSPTVITLVTVIAGAYLAVAGRNRLATLVVFSISLGALTEKLLKIGFDRSRPEVVPHLVTVHSLSFPSGHAMLSAITYLTVGALLAREQANWRKRIFVLSTGLMLTIIIGFSRVFLGVHWPTDVLAGWLAGSAWALATWIIAEKVT